MSLLESPSRQETAADPSFLERMGSEMVSIRVGPEKKLFSVHKDLLCRKIPSFKDMFKAGRKESSNGSANFPDDHVESFDLLIDWVYTGVLRPLKKAPDAIPGSRGSMSWRPVYFWQLADKMSLPELQDKIMDMWIDFENETHLIAGCTFISAAYEHTRAGSGPRRYVAEAMKFILLKYPEADMSNTHIYADLLKKHEDLALDFLLLLRGQGSTAIDPRKAPKCHFHVHDKDAECSYTT